MKAINTKRPSKLDLNAPLLSARRSNIATMSSIVMSRSNSLNGSCHRVPFLWEQSPGKPKHSQTRNNNVLEDDKALPLPKPPPFQSRQEWPTLIFHDEHGFNGNTDEDEEKEEEDDDESFSDGIDLFSLAKSLKTSSEREEEDDNNNTNNNESMSASFMIERFLPAATALAASSLSALEGDKQRNKSAEAVYVSCKEGSCVPRKAGEAYSSSKGCGLEMLFPWRVKHRVCGVKNPARQPRSRRSETLS